MNIQNIEINGNPTIELINSSEIIIEPNLQRDVECRKTQFKKIMREFQPALVNLVKVAEKDGKYICIDGQMTRKVLIARNGGKHLPVQCKVYHNLSNEEIAFLFINQNGTTANMKIADKIRVGYENGSEPEHTFVLETEKNGLSVSFSGSPSNNTIVAVKAAFDCFKKFNDVNKYGKFIRVLKAAWGGRSDSLSAEILNGLCLFMKTYEGMYQTSMLINHLSAVNPKELVRDAKVDRSGGARKYAVKILEAYNYRLTKNNKLNNIL